MNLGHQLHVFFLVIPFLIPCLSHRSQVHPYLGVRKELVLFAVEPRWNLAGRMQNRGSANRTHVLLHLKIGARPIAEPLPRFERRRQFDRTPCQVPGKLQAGCGKEAAAFLLGGSVRWDRSGFLGGSGPQRLRPSPRKWIWGSEGVPRAHDRFFFSGLWPPA